MLSHQVSSILPQYSMFKRSPPPPHRPLLSTQRKNHSVTQSSATSCVHPTVPHLNAPVPTTSSTTPASSQSYRCHNRPPPQQQRHSVGTASTFNPCYSASLLTCFETTSTLVPLQCCCYCLTTSFLRHPQSRCSVDVLPTISTPFYRHHNIVVSPLCQRPPPPSPQCHSGRFTTTTITSAGFQISGGAGGQLHQAG
ncbi:hypothetical protein BDQ17DRAFT_669150 [Cyathus striatus]|nr:hypothetical protein BDQ17DRAFT_669150 [Cyathus striatus]